MGQAREWKWFPPTMLAKGGLELLMWESHKAPRLIISLKQLGKGNRKQTTTKIIKQAKAFDP